MLRSASGLKAQWGAGTVFVVSDLEEWRILLTGPDFIIKGSREFSEDKAKAQATRIVAEYLAATGQEAAEGLEWFPIGQSEWMNWTP